jgi:hypothetical protein
MTDTTQSGAIGTPLRCKEDLRSLTGQGRNTDDFNRPGQLWAIE